MRVLFYNYQSIARCTSPFSVEGKCITEGRYELFEAGQIRKTLQFILKNAI